MKIFRVQHKVWSEIQKNLALAESDIKAERFSVNECGALVLLGEDGDPVLALPPGFWIYISVVSLLADAEQAAAARAAALVK